MMQHEAWLSIARRDLESAVKLLEGEKPLTDTALYHAHQCAEKSLKAYLSFLKLPLNKSHDLQYLVDLCVEKDATFESIYEDCITLNPYATLYRYPGFITIPDIKDARDAVRRVERILNQVISVIEHHVS